AATARERSGREDNSLKFVGTRWHRGSATLHSSELLRSGKRDEPHDVQTLASAAPTILGLRPGYSFAPSAQKSLGAADTSVCATIRAHSIFLNSRKISSDFRSSVARLETGGQRVTRVPRADRCCRRTSSLSHPCGRAWRDTSCTAGSSPARAD